MIAGIWSNYEDYLNSFQWKDKQQEIIKLKGKCAICKAFKRFRQEEWKYIKGKYKKIWVYYGKNLQVHHKTYAHIGNEPSKDLMVLCYDCHKEIHKDANDNSNR